MTGSVSTSGGAQTQVQYLDIGLNIDASIEESADGVKLNTQVEQSSIAEEKSGLGTQDPIVRQAKLEGTSILTAGKPLILGSIDIPSTAKRLDIEVVMEHVGATTQADGQEVPGPHGAAGATGHNAGIFRLAAISTGEISPLHSPWPRAEALSVMAFHEKAGRSQVDSCLAWLNKVCFSRRVATDAMLPFALSRSDSFARCILGVLVSAGAAI